MSKRAGAAALVVAALLWATGARAQDDLDPVDADRPPPSAPPLPRAHWHTLETPHFRIHFYDEERALADHAAIVAERGFHLITRYLNWQPSGAVSLTLNDQTDGANGFASSIPYNYIYGYGAPPGPLDELNDFDDYVKVLITHELTHVVHLDTIIGPVRLLNIPFGKLYAPNLSQPNWFIEGLAVLMESRQTTAGRLRSTYFDMFLRVPFLEHHLLGLDAVSNGPLVFPQGTAAYLYGSSLVRYIEDRYGPHSLQEISHRYGAKIIPGSLNRTAADVLGIGYDRLWDDWKRSMSHRYALAADEATRRGLTDARRITHEAPGARGPGSSARFLRDGALVYLRFNTNANPAYARLDLGSGEQRVLYEAHSAGALSPTPDGRALVFERTNFLPLPRRISGSSHLTWLDLFRIDLGTGELTELTRGRRAQQPDVSPDGTRIACTVGEGNARQLALVPIEGGVPRVLTAGAPGLAYSPAWSPDGRLIAYSRWKPGGYRDIHLYDVAASRDRPLWVDRAMDVDPRFTPDGRYLLFSSDRTGIYNVYAYELATGRLYQVTNLLSGAFQPVVSPDGTRLVYMGFTSDGFDLFTTAFDPAAWPLAQPSANERPDSPADVASEADSPDAQAGGGAPAPVVTTVESYQPWRYMYPRNWSLKYFQQSPLGFGSAGQVQTTVGDPVGNHALTLNLLVPGDLDASVRADYAYSGLWPSLALSFTRTASRAFDLIVDGSNVGYRQHFMNGSASIGLPVLRRPESAADLAFGYSYSAYAPADPLPVADPTAGITVRPEVGPDANLFVTWSFSNTHAWLYSISQQEGRRLQLSLQVSDPALGGRFHTTEVSWSWTEYLTPPWARLHALALLYSGGVGIGDKRAVFALGGFVDQDVVRSLFLNRRQCCLFLRGYPPATVIGDQYHLASVEYRAPLLWIERGYKTFPLYLRRLTGSVFADAGNAFYGAFQPRDLRYGVGAEVRLQFNLAYYLESEIQLGYARGLSTGGGNQLYFVTSFPF